MSDPALPTPDELDAASAGLVDATARLRRAVAVDAKARAALAQLVDRGIDLGGKALEGAAERAPEILGRALGALLEGEVRAQLGR